MTTDTTVSSDEELAFAARFATRFAFSWHGHTVHIERYDNHSRLLPEGRWVVVRHLFPIGGQITNPLYLNGSVWLYKNGQTWHSWQKARDHLRRYAARPGTNGWEMVTDGDPHAPFQLEE